MNIDRYILSKAELPNNLPEILKEFLGLDITLAKIVYKQSLENRIQRLKDNIYFFIEIPYVDKVYRDSYYHYFSSKLGNYKKDCMRLSLFEDAISLDDFTTEESVKRLKERYRGFIVLRPTVPNIFGRNIISPKAFVSNDFITCSSKFPATANFVKFEVEGFPHSSQDAETISCAETTIWALMEYFGYKYAEYKPVLPSKIIEILNRVSTERQVPTKGLDVSQMAYALREFGFGTKVYSKSEFGHDEFKRLFSCYIESGLPVITAIDNFPEGNIGHAILGIGHSNVSHDLIENLPETTGSKKIESDTNRFKTIELYDNDDVAKEYIFNDDNMPTYQKCSFDKPAIHYLDATWHNCEVKSFVVPLYPKIYLEAYEAKLFFKQVLFNYFDIPDNSKIYIRFFLTSSRSYKHKLNFNLTMEEDIKGIIEETAMPKFIWVGEISTRELIKNKQANGLIVIDATEANTQFLRPLILGAYLNSLISIDSKTNLLKEKTIPLQTFSIFTNNLK